MTPGYHTYVQLVRDERHAEQDGVLVHFCDLCGRRRVTGDWPACPHGRAHFGEEAIEPYWDENISESGELITTRGQRRALMNKNHLEYRKKRTDLLPSETRYFDLGRR